MSDNEANLELLVNLKGDEVALCHIHDMLVNAQSDGPPLSDIFAEMVEQTLAAVGVSEKIEVELLHGQVNLPCDSGGGLSPKEWLESGEIEDQLSHSPEFKEDEYQD